MHPQTRSQQEYQAFVSEQLKSRYIDPGHPTVLLLHADLIAKLWFADLSAVFPLVLPRYSKSKRGAINFAWPDPGNRVKSGPRVPLRLIRGAGRAENEPTRSLNSYEDLRCRPLAYP